MTQIEKIALDAVIETFIKGHCDLDKFIENLCSVIEAFDKVSFRYQEQEKQSSLWLQYPEIEEIKSFAFPNTIQLSLKGRLINGSTIGVESGPLHLTEIYRYGKATIYQRVIENLWRDLYEIIFTEFIKQVS